MTCITVPKWCTPLSLSDLASKTSHFFEGIWAICAISLTFLIFRILILRFCYPFPVNEPHTHTCTPFLVILFLLRIWAYCKIRYFTGINSSKFDFKVICIELSKFVFYDMKVSLQSIFFF